jgi:hypothetical protein
MFLSCQCYLHVRRDHGDARRTRVRSHTKFKLSVYKCWGRLTLQVPRPTWALARSSDIAMLSRGPARPPRYNSIPSRVSPHPHEVACVLNTITEILAASAEIIRRDEVYPFCNWTHDFSSLTVVPTTSHSEETHWHVYLPIRWTEYLPSQYLYGKRLCRSLYPPSHHFTSP